MKTNEIEIEIEMRTSNPSPPVDPVRNSTFGTRPVEWGNQTNEISLRK